MSSIRYSLTYESLIVIYKSVNAIVSSAKGKCACTIINRYPLFSGVESGSGGPVVRGTPLVVRYMYLQDSLSGNAFVL